MATTPVDTIERSHQSVFQIVAIAVIVGLNGLDVLAISFAAPGIAEEFGINRGALGFVLAAELVSMGIGSIVLGGVADKIGRRPMILGCLVAMLAGMLLSSRADSIATLAIRRILTGVGIGGRLAAITAAAPKHSEEKNRSLCGDQRDRLSDRRGVGRFGGRLAAGQPRLARGVRFRRLHNRGLYPAGIAAGTGNGRVSMPAPAARRIGPNQHHAGTDGPCKSRCVTRAHDGTIQGRDQRPVRARSDRDHAAGDRGIFRPYRDLLFHP